MRPPALSRRARTRCATLALMAVIPFAGCSDDHNPVDPEPGSIELQGVYVEAHQAGVLYGEYMRIKVATHSLAPARTRKPAIAAEADLSHWVHTGITTFRGSYRRESGTLYLSDQGHTFTGGYEAEESSIIGTATTTVSPAIFACAVDGRSAISLYSGTFESENQLPTRHWASVIAGARLYGLRSGTLGDSHALSGSVSGAGSSRALVVSGELGDGAFLHASGTLNTETEEITGSYRMERDGASLDSGTWSGARTDVQDVMEVN